MTRPGRHRRRRLGQGARALAGLVAALALGLGGGAAYAYVTSSARGTGTAVVGGVPSRVTVEAATGTVANELRPGGSTTGNELQPGGSGDLLVTLQNANPFPVTLTGLSQNGSVTVLGGSGCTAANAGVSVTARTDLSITIPSGTNTVSVPDGISMSSASDSGCQGASFDIPVVVTVRQGSS